MFDSVPMTREGFNKLKAEIDRLENEELPKITEKIAEARAEGDLKENAEYLSLIHISEPTRPY